MNFFMRTAGNVITPPDQIPGFFFDLDPNQVADGVLASYTNNGITIASGNGPTVVANEIDGKKIIRVAINKLLTGNNADWDRMHQSPTTCFWLVKATTDATTMDLWDSSNHGSTGHGRLLQITSNNIVRDNRYNGSIAYQTDAKYVTPYNTWHLFVFKAGGGTYNEASQEIDNLETDVTPNINGAYSGTTSSFNPTFFKRSGIGNTFIGDVARAIFFDGELSNTDIDKVVAYLKSEYPTTVTWHDRPKWRSNGKVVTLDDNEVVLDTTTGGSFDYQMMAASFYWGGITNTVYRLGGGHNEGQAGFLVLRRRINGAWSAYQTFKASDPVLMLTNPSEPHRLSNGTWIRFYLKQLANGSSAGRALWFSTSTDGDSGLDAATWSEETLMTTDFATPGMYDGPGFCYEEGGYVYKAVYARPGSSGGRGIYLYRALITDFIFTQYATIEPTSIPYDWQEPSIIKLSNGLYVAFLRSEGSNRTGCYLTWSWDLLRWSRGRWKFPSVNKPSFAISPSGTICMTGRSSLGDGARANWGYSNDNGWSFTSNYLDSRPGAQMGSGTTWNEERQEFEVIWSSEVGAPYTSTNLMANTLTES